MAEDADDPGAPEPVQVFNVGTMPDGTLIQSGDGATVTDDTIVWLEPTPGDRMTVTELEDAFGDDDEDGEILWSIEPEPSPVPPGRPDAQEAKVAAVTIGGDTPTKAMIALAPKAPESIAVDGGDPPEALHTTLKFLQDAAPWEPERRQAVEDIVAAWASRQPGPLTAKVGGAGYLGADGAAVAHLDVPGLTAARAALNDEIMAVGGPEGVDVADTYDGFVPHLTTGYGVEPPVAMIGSPVEFDRVRVHWGTDVREFPLGGGAHVAALSEAEIDEAADALAAAESRIGELEGLVAQALLGDVTDSLFDDEDTPLAVTASLRPRFVEIAARLGDTGTAVARVAALDDIPDDMADRVEKLNERLDALEKTIGKLLIDSVEDAELSDQTDLHGTDYVDETLDRGAKTAATGLPLDQEARDKAAKAGEALPDGKLPIRSVEELRSAISLRGKVEGHSDDEIRRHIVKRAKALGHTELLPDDWSVS